MIPAYFVYVQFGRPRVQINGLHWPLNHGMVKTRVRDYEHDSSQIGLGDRNIGFRDGQEALSFWRRVLAEMEQL